VNKSEFVFNELGIGGPLAIAFWHGLEPNDVAQLLHRTYLRRATEDE
jgi:hypothetical protein